MEFISSIQVLSVLPGGTGMLLQGKMTLMLGTALGFGNSSAALSEMGCY